MTLRTHHRMADLIFSKLFKALEWLINTTWKGFCFNLDLRKKKSIILQKKLPLKKSILKFSKK